MTQKQLERENKTLKTRISIYRTQVLESRRKLKSLTAQYEAVVKEWRKIVDDLLSNAPKLFFLYLKRKWDRKRGNI